MKKRSINLDLIRCCAVWSVLSVHFFWNNGFYEQIIIGKRLYVMVLMRTAFMVCVPLFLLLTGYLMGNKEISWKYYLGESIIRIIFIYYISSAAYILVSRYVFHESISLKESIFDILGVKSIGYGWYVEMYVGLYLMIPFLNILYQGLKSKREKQCLIIVLLICTTLPTIFDVAGLNMASWWTALYPITYYYIGAYIREYDFNLPLWRNVLILGACIAVFATINYYKSYADVFEWSMHNNWYGFENVIDAVLTFVFLLHIRIESLPELLKKGISKVSELSFGVYLLSSISDKLIYPVLNKNVIDMPKRLEWYIIVVPISFMIAMLFSYILNIIYGLIGHKIYIKFFEICKKGLKVT